MPSCVPSSEPSDALLELARWRFLDPGEQLTRYRVEVKTPLQLLLQIQRQMRRHLGVGLGAVSAPAHG